MLKGLYGVTDGQLLPDDRILLEAVEAALRGGMKVLQYRDKSLDADKRLRQASMLRVLCHSYQALFIINDDIELAADVEADGVHLGQQDGSIAEARQRLGDYAIIGISCEGSVEQADTAVQHGANYIAFGRFFPSRTKPDAKPADLSLLPTVKKAFTVPVVAIGGITMDNAAQLIEAGADMIAVVHNLFASTDIESRAREFSTLFNQEDQE